MSDDDLSELILRASAYLDGELDAAEMARAEATPAVMAEVEQLRALQVSLRDVDPPTSQARERAIAAALAEFDAGSGVPAVADTRTEARPSPVVPFRPRPAYGRWLTVAAACVAVGVLGIVVSNGVGGGDDEAAGQIDDVDTAAFDAGTSARAEASIFADSAAAEESASTELATSATAAPAADAGSAEASAAASELTPGAPATTSATDQAAPAPTSTIVFDPDVALADVGQLMSAGAQLATLDRAGTLTTPETACDIAQFEALSIGLYDDGTGERSVLIAVDPATDQVAAFDDTSCELVAFTPLP